MRKIQALAMIMIVLAMQLSMVRMTFAAHTATIEWVKTQKDHSSYLLMPGNATTYYWNGITPKWIQFTVRNNGPDGIKEIKLIFQKFPDGNSMFNFSQTSQSKAGWYVTPDEFGLNKRPTVLYFRTDSQYIQNGETVTFGLLMTEGPEECGHNIDVWTVDAGSTPSTNFYELWIKIDKHAPMFDDHVTPPPGSIFNQTTNPTVEVTANATDIWPSPNTAPHISNIKNMTLCIDYRVNTGTTLPNGPPNPTQPSRFCTTMKWDTSRKIYYVVLDETFGLIDEAWHDCTVTFYDYAENGPVTQRNFTYFFWFLPHDLVYAKTTDVCFLQWKLVNGNEGVGHVGGNAIVERDSGFKPNEYIRVTFDNIELTPSAGAQTSNWGRFKYNFVVPTLPFGPHTIELTPITNPNARVHTHFHIIPWMEIVGDRSGNVDNPITVKGTGFGANVDMNVVYRDVSRGLPEHTSETTEWSDNLTSTGTAIGYTWSPHLENLTWSKHANGQLIKTDNTGSFTFSFTIPESYGGWHPVFAQEVISGRRSGWMNVPATVPPSIFPEAAFVNVTTKTWTVPKVGLTGQYVQIFATGLPLPAFHSETYDCITKKTKTVDHAKMLALDFGPDKYWVFEKGFILNNEFDYGWAVNLYLPFAYWYNHDDPQAPSWSGTLYWKDANDNLHLGSQFLKVPVLAPGVYDISLYQFDLVTEADEWDYLATTTFSAFKDPLCVRTSSGTLYFKGETVTVYAEIDLDGFATNPTAISFRLYREDSFLMSLTSKPVGDAEGLYVASFTCPSQTGNYFVKVNATKTLDGMTLYGFGATVFTVSPTLDGLNATLTSLNNGIATISSTVGTLKLDLNEIKGNVTSINGNLATINTDIGQVKTDISTINSKLVGLEGDIATVKTDLGEIKTKLDNLNMTVTALGADNVIIKTSLGEVQGKVTNIQDKTVDIQTNIGKMSTTTDSIQTQTGLQQTGIALSLIAALAAIIAAILVFRKLYK